MSLVSQPGDPIWLHPECIRFWPAPVDDLEIPGFLDRRHELGKDRP